VRQQLVSIFPQVAQKSQVYSPHTPFGQFLGEPDFILSDVSCLLWG
jgi:hypothetical protein